MRATPVKDVKDCPIWTAIRARARDTSYIGGRFTSFTSLLANLDREMATFLLERRSDLEICGTAKPHTNKLPALANVFDGRHV